MTEEGPPTAEVIAEKFIEQMKESGRWEELRVDLASTLRLNNDYKKTKAIVQQYLSTDVVKPILRSPNTTEESLAAYIAKTGGLDQYRKELAKNLQATALLGHELLKEISQYVDQQFK